MSFLETEFLKNSMQTWGIALAVAVVVYATLKIIRAVFVGHLARIAEKTATRLDDLAVTLVRSIRFPTIPFIALFAGSIVLTLPEEADKVIRSATILVMLLQGGRWGGVLITYYLTATGEQRRKADPASATAFGAVVFMVKLALWSTLLLLALANMGIDVSALIAGLGIGGIAIALALQNILGDIFCSVAILLDKPFAAGDFIVTGGFSGTVDRIGIKTTRLRSLQGEQVVLANSDLVKNPIQNFKRMEERRVAFTFGVTYQTSREQLKALPSALRKIITEVETARFDRAHFSQYGDFALIFEVVYYVVSADYLVYMDTQERINLALYQYCADQKIAFAYPTQTIYLARSDRPSA